MDMLRYRFITQRCRGLKSFIGGNETSNSMRRWRTWIRKIPQCPEAQDPDEGEERIESAAVDRGRDELSARKQKVQWPTAAEKGQ